MLLTTIAITLNILLLVSSDPEAPEFFPSGHVIQSTSKSRLEKDTENLVLDTTHHTTRNRTVGLANMSSEGRGMLEYLYSQLQEIVVMQQSDLQEQVLMENNVNSTVDQALYFAEAKERVDLAAMDPKRKGKWCMKNLTKCMNENDDYIPTLHKLSSALFQSFPPIDFTETNGVSPECKRANRRYLEDLYSFQFSAMKMYDSTAKIPSGILSGNIQNFGDFDLCIQSAKVSTDFFKANAEPKAAISKYCLAAIQIETPQGSAYLAAIHNIIYAHNAFVSKLSDPGHRVPKFSSINWGFCIPDDCSARDLEIGLRSIISKLLNNTDLSYEMSVDSNMCTSSAPSRFPNSFFLASCGISTSQTTVAFLWISAILLSLSVSGFFLSILIVSLIATVYDFKEYDANRYKWILTFSLKKNVIYLFDMRQKADDLDAIHGIRFLNAMMLLLAHKSMALLFQPYVNRTEMSEIIGQPWTVLGRAASLYTDPFIMISGTLTAYSLFGRLQKGIPLNLITEYISRLFRIVPTLGALILFCTFVLPELNSGPLWNQVVGHHGNICQKYWWRNLLFIHNYYGFEDMCLTHTHHVGIDTQLFFISPLLILTVWKWPKIGSAFLVIIATASTIMRYYVTYTRGLSNYVHFGTSIEQLFNTADYMYILPVHRLTVYIMGIFLGYLLRFYKNVTLRTVQLYTGNILAITSFIVSFFGAAFMGHIDYIYNPIDAAWYAAFAPILWCFAFAWVIFSSHIGQNGPVNQLASIPIFKLWTKVSYCVYLTQFPIFFYNVGTTKHSGQYNFISKNVNVLEILTILLSSAILTVLFETPFQNIKSLIFKKTKSIKLESDFRVTKVKAL